MRRRIATMSELEEVIDFSQCAPGFRLVCEMDLILNGAYTRKTLTRLGHAATWIAVGRTDTPEPPGPWADRAACVGHRMYYAAHQVHRNRVSRADREFEAQALDVCRACPVLEPCRAWALQDVEPAVDHVAGGTTPRQRHNYRMTGRMT